MDSFTKDMIIPIIVLVFGILITAFGIYFWYEIDDTIDFNFVHNQILNNKTFVDELTCDNISKAKVALAVMKSPKKQDEVEQLKIDFDELYKLKDCGSN